MAKISLPKRSQLVCDNNGLQLYKATKCFNLIGDGFRLTVSEGKERSYVGVKAIRENEEKIREFIQQLEGNIQIEFLKLVDKIVAKGKQEQVKVQDVLNEILLSSK